MNKYRDMVAKHSKSLLMLFLLSAVPVSLLAHHSNAMFDYDKTRVLKGVVDQFGYTNPHGYLQLLVTASSGRVQNWTIEFQTVSGMAKQGLRPESFKYGDNVTVVIHPLRSGRTGGDFLGAVLADGTTLGDVSLITSSED